MVLINRKFDTSLWWLNAKKVWITDLYVAFRRAFSTKPINSAHMYAAHKLQMSQSHFVCIFVCMFCVWFFFCASRTLNQKDCCVLYVWVCCGLRFIVVVFGSCHRILCIYILVLCHSRETFFLRTKLTYQNRTIAVGTFLAMKTVTSIPMSVLVLFCVC